MDMKNIKSILSDNVSMDTVSKIKVKTISRSYRIEIDLVEALLNTEMNVTKFINNSLRKELEEKGLL